MSKLLALTDREADLVKEGMKLIIRLFEVIDQEKADTARRIIAKLEG